MKNRATLILKGGILALVLSVLFSLLLAAAVWSLDLPEGLLCILIFAIAAASAACSAFAACRSAGSKGLFTGGSIGVIFYIALLAVAVILKKEFSFDLRAIIMLITALISGMLGGVLGMPR